MSLKVAVIQFNATDDKLRNIYSASRLVVKAAKAAAKFILLPEVFNCRARMVSLEDLSKIAETIPGPSTRPLVAIAKKYKVYILAGSVLEKGRLKKAYNSSVLISPEGKIKAKYHKQNLFDAVVSGKKIKESVFLLRGEKCVLADVNGMKTGLTICYDLRFADVYRRYARKGAEIICIPSAFTKKTGQAHWEVLVRARAIETQCYCLAPNQVGKDARGVATYGHSLIVDPWGKVLKRASGDKEEIIYAVLSKNNINKVKRILPAVIK